MALSSVRLASVAVAFFVAFVAASGGRAMGVERPRVVVSTDIGGSDPDDFQSMVHYLVCADAFRTEGLVSSPPGRGRKRHILECLAAYEADYPNLSSWSRDYPSPDALRAVARQGAVDPQVGDEPEGDMSDGARLIAERAAADEEGPLWCLVWGSITDVAQAVHARPGIKSRLRVYSIGSWNTSQDRKARDYLFRNHPDLWWVESDTTFRGMYMGGDQGGELGNAGFPEAHVKGHGRLGELFMSKKRDIKMGDSPSVLYLLDGDRARPETPHWGGAFVRPHPDARPLYWHDDPAKALAERGRKGAKTVSRWRKEYLAHWRERMDRAAARRDAGE